MIDLPDEQTPETKDDHTFPMQTSRAVAEPFEEKSGISLFLYIRFVHSIYRPLYKIWTGHDFARVGPFSNQHTSYWKFLNNEKFSIEDFPVTRMIIGLLS